MSTDPTAIPIERDPLRQRFIGTAVHGNTPSDVPYISPITDDLWQGGCENGLLLPPEVKHVISLYPWEAYRARHDLATNMAVRLYDSLDELDGPTLVGIAQWVNVCRRTGVTLVHCQAGLNRSSLIAGLALVLDGMSSDEAIGLLREKRSPACLCNPKFEQWLREYDAGPGGIVTAYLEAKKA